MSAADIPEVRAKIDRLRKALHYHNRKYYIDNAPEITDFDYDMLMKKLEALEAEYPELVTPDSPTQTIEPPRFE